MICSYNERLGVSKYLEDTKSKSKIIVYCSKSQMTPEIMKDNRWVMVNHHFRRIIRFIQKTPILIPNIITEEQQKIEHRQQKLKMNQHRVSVAKWANNTSLLNPI